VLEIVIYIFITIIIDKTIIIMDNLGLVASSFKAFEDMASLSLATS
jgi:hypothetical protein